MKNLALHWKIIIGLLTGLAYGILSASAGWGSFTSDWIAPFGTIFINLLKLIAVPLVFASLVTGVASLSDTKKLSRIGGRTITIYICTTVVSVTIGLFLVNFFQPGGQIPSEMKTELQETYEKNIETKTNSAQKVKERGPLNKVVGDNISQVIELMSALGFYMFTLILGLILHVCISYLFLIKYFTKMPLQYFLKGIAPAQLLAFSTSSSGATLPITMERCEEELGVSEEISSFVLPLGATINMDGTAQYQAVAAVFISQALGMDLTLGDQVTIILTTVLASIGTAAVPAAGIIMLIIILESVGVPSAGVALILGVDRILDMARTTVNVTGDAAVAVSVASSEKQLKTYSK